MVQFEVADAFNQLGRGCPLPSFDPCRYSFLFSWPGIIDENSADDGIVVPVSIVGELIA